MADQDERTVLVAMDGSSYADYAFDYYLKNVKYPNDKVILLHCVELHQPFMAMGVGSADILNSMIEEERMAADAYLTKLTDMMKNANLHGVVKQVHGAPREQIIKAAEEANARMIVTGTRGMGTVKRTLLGSVSDHVLHHSHIPVLVCRHKDDHQKFGHHGHTSK